MAGLVYFNLTFAGHEGRTRTQGTNTDNILILPTTTETDTKNASAQTDSGFSMEQDEQNLLSSQVQDITLSLLNLHKELSQGEQIQNLSNFAANNFAQSTPGLDQITRNEKIHQDFSLDTTIVPYPDFETSRMMSSPKESSTIFPTLDLTASINPSAEEYHGLSSTFEQEGPDFSFVSLDQQSGKSLDSDLINPDEESNLLYSSKLSDSESGMSTSESGFLSQETESSAAEDSGEDVDDLDDVIDIEAIVNDVIDECKKDKRNVISNEKSIFHEILDVYEMEKAKDLACSDCAETDKSNARIQNDFGDEKEALIEQLEGSLEWDAHIPELETPEEYEELEFIEFFTYQ